MFVHFKKLKKMDDCKKCKPVTGFYLGITCIHCGKPFRNVVVDTLDKNKKQVSKKYKKM